ncbi:MAG TPA: sigma-54 dependent transcriptional regulator [Burkholderiales bacterium]|nr:sigma-54 dependent transcriptional regulator [Burkholderiales bacterium]
MLPVLVVEDDEALRDALIETFALAGYEVITATDAIRAMHIIRQRPLGLVLTDVQMEKVDGHELLAQIKAGWPSLPVILMTAYGVIDRAVDAMQSGAASYLAKPFEPERLLAEVARHMLPQEGEAKEAYLGDDPGLKQIYDMALRVAPSDATCMITGESGCGKELLARFLHINSQRKNNPFVAINCAAIPENLLESTLFGYEKGAFSGALAAHAGKFEQAQGGTLLLDEISEMPLSLQAKLLRVLQEKEVERIGSTRTLHLDVRVLATSNRLLAEEVNQGRFREDLYYRLNVIPLELPPLRARPSDIIPLAEHFLKNRKGGHSLWQLTPAAKLQLTQYDWPGNIRELENVMQRAAIMAPSSIVDVEHLFLPAQKPVLRQQTVDMRTLERDHILETLERAKGSRKQAAELLGMSERTLRHKLRQYRLQESEGAKASGGKYGYSGN